MSKLQRVPKEGETLWFYSNDQIRKQNECKAKVVSVIPFASTASKMVYKYDDYAEDLIAEPVMDLWLEEVLDLFWILSGETDYIIQLYVPDLCAQDVYVARTIDGGWHSFETANFKQFGILDVTGELHDQLYKND